MTSHAALEFEKTLQDLAAECADPDAGLFGPGTAAWEINKEMATLAGAGRALLLQLAHPVVANGLQAHSQMQRDMVGRLRSTSAGVLALLYGDLPTTLHGARALYRVHARVRGEIVDPGPQHPVGTAYRAVHPDALFWVHATLLDSAVRAYELYLRPLRRHELTAYYADGRRFAQLYGIPRGYMPQTWNGFQQRFQQVIERDLAVSDWARGTAELLLETRKSVLRPLLEYERLFTAYLLPPVLRQAYNLPWGAAQQMTLRASLPGLRAAYAALPPQLRYWPAYLDARRRLRGKGPDRIGRALEAWVMDALPQAS